MNPTNSALERHFQLYQEQLLKQAWYSAAVTLAEIYHASARLPAKQRAAWRSRVNKDLDERFLRDVKILGEVRKGRDHEIRRIHRVLSVGSEWTGEEILLVILMRINAKLLSDFIGSAVDVESQVYLEDIDVQLSTLAKSKNHAHHVRWALQRMKYTAPNDVESVWLSLINQAQT